jgi:CelD/BcsL family acetyltransferase involved in cellulose biosynthesis
MNAAAQHTYHVTCLRHEPEFCDLAPAWAELLAGTPEASVFLTWDWAYTWWRHRDVEAGLWILAAYDETDRLAGVAPWMLVHDRLGPLPLRRVAFLGTGMVYPVHLDVIARPEEAAGVSGAFMAYLKTHRREWDALDLADLVPGSALGRCLESSGWRYREREGAIARFTSLPDSFEAYERDLMTGTRRGHMRQKRRKLEREHQGVLFERVSDPVGVEKALVALTQLHQVRFHGKHITTAFDNDSFLAFHREMAGIALERGWLRFYVLRVGEQIIAALYGFRFGDVYFAYQAAFDGAWGKYSPGYLLFTFAIEQSIAEGVREWNMMRGDQEYKLSWTHALRTDEHLVLGSTLAGRLWVLSGTVYDGAKRVARERLPQNVQDRLVRMIWGRDFRDEPAASAESREGTPSVAG